MDTTNLTGYLLLFGLKNTSVLKIHGSDFYSIQSNELFVCLDNIVIYASSLTEYDIKFYKLIDRLSKAKLQLQPDKCKI